MSRGALYEKLTEMDRKEHRRQRLKKALGCMAFVIVAFALCLAFVWACIQMWVHVNA